MILTCLWCYSALSFPLNLNFLCCSGNANQGTSNAATGNINPLSKTRSAKTLKAWLRPASGQPAAGVPQGSPSTPAEQGQ